MKHNFKDITDCVFGRLQAKKYIGDGYWSCRCECGNTTKAYGGNLRSGKQRSCGCLRNESVKQSNLRHGAYRNGVRTPELSIYYGIRKRCNNPNDQAYRYYGGRGIECRFYTFQEFINEIGPRPSVNHSIDRINNNGHYEVGNVRWANRRQQALNSNIKRKLTLDDIPKIKHMRSNGYTQREIAEEFDVTRETIRDILKGRIWSHV